MPGPKLVTHWTMKQLPCTALFCLRLVGPILGIFEFVSGLNYPPVLEASHSLHKHGQPWANISGDHANFLLSMGDCWNMLRHCISRSSLCGRGASRRLTSTRYRCSREHRDVALNYLCGLRRITCTKFSTLRTPFTSRSNSFGNLKSL